MIHKEGINDQGVRNSVKRVMVNQDRILELLSIFRYERKEISNNEGKSFNKFINIYAETDAAALSVFETSN